MNIPSLVVCYFSSLVFFFFNDTATTEIYTLSLHDALPILSGGRDERAIHAESARTGERAPKDRIGGGAERVRSEEHTSELQSQSNLVCRLLLEKKKKHFNRNIHWPIICSTTYTKEQSQQHK